MSKQTFSVDDTLYRAQAKKLVRQLKLNEAKFVNEQAGLLAQLFCKVTPPFKSFPKLSGKPTYGGNVTVGRNAVRRDFFRAVQRVGKDSSWNDKKIAKAIRAGDTNYIEQRLKYMKGSNKKNLKVRKFDDRLHDSKRNSRGRVNRNTLPTVALKNPDVNKGLKRAMDRVGIAKAAFAIAALRFGRPAPKDWIRKQFRKVNTPVKMATNSSPLASFTATAKGVDMASSKIKEVERFRMIAMVKRLEALVKADVKKAGF